MSDFPKFLLATNEAALPGAVFIIHTRKPSFIAKVEKLDIIFLDFLSPTEIKDAEKLAKELSGIMRRMADWYYFNYLKK